MIPVCLGRNSVLLFFPPNLSQMAIKKCPVAVSATQRICFSASRGLWFLWNLVVFTVSLAEPIPRSGSVTLLLSHHLVHLSPDWKWSKGRGFGGWLPSSKEAALCLCQVEWIASVFGGTEEFWIHSPVSHKRSLEGRQGGEGDVGIQLILFQKRYLCWTWYHLWLSWGLSEALKYLNFGLNMVKVYLRVSYPT